MDYSYNHVRGNVYPSKCSTYEIIRIKGQISKAYVGIVHSLVR